MNTGGESSLDHFLRIQSNKIMIEEGALILDPGKKITATTNGKSFGVFHFPTKVNPGKSNK